MTDEIHHLKKMRWSLEDALAGLYKREASVCKRMPKQVPVKCSL
jgi:hypothetical protein